MSYRGQRERKTRRNTIQSLATARTVIIVACHTDAIVKFGVYGRVLSLHGRQSQLSALQPSARTVPQSRLQCPSLGSHGLDRQNPASLLGQLGPRLRVRVEQSEVGHDHRNRKCYGQHAGQSAQRADEHTYDRFQQNGVSSQTQRTQRISEFPNLRKLQPIETELSSFQPNSSF